MNRKLLWVDDVRPAPSDEWDVARSATESIVKLWNEHYTVVSLDHDIFENHAFTQSLSRETFLATALFIAMMRKEDQPSLITIHTANWNAGITLRRLLEKETNSKIVRVSPDPEEVGKIVARWDKRNS